MEEVGGVREFRGGLRPEPDRDSFLPESGLFASVPRRSPDLRPISLAPDSVEKMQGVRCSDRPESQIDRRIHVGLDDRRGLGTDKERSTGFGKKKRQGYLTGCPPLSVYLGKPSELGDQFLVPWPHVGLTGSWWSI